MSKCIITGVDLTPEEESEAHVIPNALGGRYKPRGVLSKIANSDIGQYVEGPFIRRYAPLMALLGAKRQRGDHPPFTVEGPDGMRYRYDPDGEITPAKPSYRSEATGTNGERIEIVARTMSELRTLLGRVTANHPEFDVEMAVTKAQVTSEVSPTVKVELEFGPHSAFPLTFFAAATLNAARGLPHHPDAGDYLRIRKSIDPNLSAKLPPDTFYWEPGFEWTRQCPPASHVIASIASPRRKLVITCLRLAGLATMATVTPYAGSHARLVSYAVDVVAGQNIDASVDAKRIAQEQWSATHIYQDDPEPIQSIVRSRIAILVEEMGRLGKIR